MFVPDFSRMMQLLNGAQYWLLHELAAVIQSSYLSESIIDFNNNLFWKP